MTAEETGANQVGAVILAAGRSRRMGQPKLALQWGSLTVIEQVVATLLKAGISEIVVVTGGARQEVEAALANYPVRLVHNPDYACSEMLTSLQVGIRALPVNCQALLVVLGDQPTIEREVIKKVVDTAGAANAVLAIPSYQMRRGHPWLVGRELWPDLLAMSADQTMRDFLRSHENRISYIQVDSPGILKDIDTPEDYQRLRPE